MAKASRAARRGTTVLIAVDPPIIRCAEQACATVGLTLLIAPTVDDATIEDVEVIVCPDDGFPALQRRRPRASVLVYGDVSNSARAIDAIKHGAIDYLVRPLAPAVLADQLRAALRISREPARPADYDRPPDRGDDIDRMIGQSPAIQEVYKATARGATVPIWR